MAVMILHDEDGVSQDYIFHNGNLYLELYPDEVDYDDSVLGCPEEGSFFGIVFEGTVLEVLDPDIVYRITKGMWDKG